MSLKSLTSIHSVRIMRHEVTRGAGGGQVRRPRLVRTMKCRVQPLRTREINEFEKEGSEVTHRVFFSQDPQVDVNYWFEFRHRGKKFNLQVNGVRNAGFLDRVWVVECESRDSVDVR